MEILRGIPVSHGVAIGPALVLDVDGIRVPQRRIATAQVEAEVVRLHEALNAAAAETRQLQQSISDRLGKNYGSIFGAHSLLYEDPTLVHEFEQVIRKEHLSAETAISRVIRNYIRTLESLGSNQLFALRSADLHDIEKKMLDQLLGERKEPLRNLVEPSIVLAYDLSPSETATLDPLKVFAFATEHGGKTSHTAIIANALEIPAVVGLGKFLADLTVGDLVIVDGTQGFLVLDPDAPTLRRYQMLLKEQQKEASLWVEDRDLPTETKDGTPIVLLGNIEFPSEATHCNERGAHGVGLYRTEFLYLGKNNDPTEEEHFQSYLSVLKEVGNERPVVIRTLDLGADKFAARTHTGDPEKNPSLGLRSVRFCLRNQPLFRTQIRAILRASAFGKIRIMFPMVGTLLELRQCKMLVAEVKEDLDEEGILFNRDVPIGTMIEVPSAALLADQFAKEVDFFSIGTNDLVQYTLAADRTNENVAHLYTPSDPAVLRLIRMVVEAAQKHQIEVNVCGEMSGDPLYTQLLLGMGIRQLSATPHNLPEIKRIIRLVDMTEAERIAREAFDLETARDVTSFLNNRLRRILPEAVD
jgi:phosphoenolpyruvate-protein phosphotransferase (PTS system enzyme I)